MTTLVERLREERERQWFVMHNLWLKWQDAVEEYAALVRTIKAAEEQADDV